MCPQSALESEVEKEREDHSLAVIELVCLLRNTPASRVVFRRLLPSCLLIVCLSGKGDSADAQGDQPIFQGCPLAGH